MPGRCRVDLHAKVLDETVVQRAKERGIDAIVYAPHFERLPEIRRLAERHTDDELLVVPGREVFTGSWRSRKHVLALGLSEPVPDYISLPAAMAELARQGAAVLAPHPAFLNVSLEATDLARYGESIHAVEVYNPKHRSSHNRRAEALARAEGLPVFGSSYAHLRGSVGEVWTAFDRPLPSEEAVVEALRSGAPRTVGHRRGPRHEWRRAAEFAHLFWENSLPKALLLAKGAKPTNPHHPAYGGRFDEVASYGPPRVRQFQG